MCAVLTNFVFTLGSLFESVVVLSLAFHDSESLLPAAIDPALWALVLRPSTWFHKGLTSSKQTRTARPQEEGSSGASAALHKLRGAKTRASVPSTSVQQAATLGHVDEVIEQVTALASPPSPSFSLPGLVAEVEANDWRRHHSPTSEVEASVTKPPGGNTDNVSRLIFFENLFFRLDVDGSSTISFDEMRRLLAFTALDMTSADVDAALIAADTEGSVGGGDGELNRHECANCMPSHPDLPTPAVLLVTGECSRALVCG